MVAMSPSLENSADVVLVNMKKKKEEIGLLKIWNCRNNYNCLHH